MNQISTAMRDLLLAMDQLGGVYCGCGDGNASRLASLRKRGLATLDRPGGRWRITDAGRAVLAKEQSNA